MADAKVDKALEVLLLAWGRTYGTDYREEPRWRRTPSHPLAQKLQFSPGKSVRQATRALLGRSGIERRRYIGRNAGLLTKEGEPIPVSGYFIDPIRCKETRSFGSHVERPVPAELQRVEAAVRELEGISMVRALCVRVEYAQEGRQADKFPRVTEHMRKVKKDFKGVSLSGYRDELMYGRFFLHGRLLDMLKAA